MSTIKLENIQTRTGSGTITIGASGETVALGSGVTSGAGMGKVLQVSDMAIQTTTQTLATETYTDLTGASINITPTSTSSKIFMCVNINCFADDNEGYGIQFVRNSTSIFTTKQPYAQYLNNNGVRTMATFNFIDSPATLSEITYKVQVASYNNLSIIFQNSAQTTFYLMEIAG